MSAPPTARSGVSMAEIWTLSLTSSATSSLADQAGRDQLVAGLEVGGRHVGAHVLEVGDGTRLLEPGRHLLEGDRGLDRLGRGALGHELVDDVDLDQGLLATALSFADCT